MDLHHASQEEIVKGMKNGAFKTTIVGVGTLGTYIAAEFLKAGAQVLAADVRPDVVEAMRTKANSR